MMKNADDNISREALTWLVRVNDPEFDDWAAFDAWMAADQAHADAYWVFADRDDALSEALSDIEAPVKSEVYRFVPAASRKPRTWDWRWSAAAATIVLMIAASWVGYQSLPQPMTLSTSPGERTTFTLADGSEVVLDGDSQISFDKRKPRRIELERGRVLFSVHHDESRLFTVYVGSASITDLGTVFDVTRLPDGTRVSVSEGAVRIADKGRAAELHPGDSVRVSAQSMAKSVVDPAGVAGWTRGRFKYENEPLTIVLSDIARAVGTRIEVDPGLDQRTFTGALSTGESLEALRPRLELALNVKIIDSQDGYWRVKPKT